MGEGIPRPSVHATESLLGTSVRQIKRGKFVKILNTHSEIFVGIGILLDDL